MPQEFDTPGQHIHQRYGRIEYEERIIRLCNGCHKIVHKTFSNAQLLYRYNTAEKLLDSAVFRAHLRNMEVPTPIVEAEPTRSVPY